MENLCDAHIALLLWEVQNKACGTETRKRAAGTEKRQDCQHTLLEEMDVSGTPVHIFEGSTTVRISVCLWIISIKWCGSRDRC